MRREHNITTETPLPSGYTRLQYIKSTGTQYVDTRVAFSVKPNVKITASFTQPQHNHWIFGFWQQNIAGGYIGVYNDSFIAGFGADADSNRTPIGLIPFDTNKHTFIIDRSGNYFDNTKITNSDFTKSTPSGYNRLFARLITSQTAYLFEIYGDSALIYECILTDVNGDFIRNYVPALRQSDNKPGFYDLSGSICPSTNTPFYINAGTGEFQYA